ncbi:hypothetical protein BDN70DRAFT_901577 [Pholiota conissans]|uniref:Uncharacterized protein n=1 Tax=Pholiota conissans TaxID=109636 RepID=A0A9P6CLY1_9AGAR|nr:hypothetical protein BDN70DRAFT_901577 [Pholiota conissans]
MSTASSDDDRYDGAMASELYSNFYKYKKERVIRRIPAQNVRSGCSPFVFRTHDQITECWTDDTLSPPYVMVRKNRPFASAFKEPVDEMRPTFTAPPSTMTSASEAAVAPATGRNVTFDDNASAGRRSGTSNDPASLPLSAPATVNGGVASGSQTPTAPANAPVRGRASDAAVPGAKRRRIIANIVNEGEVDAPTDALEDVEFEDAVRSPYPMQINISSDEE